MRILFVTSNRLGDAVLSTGLLDHLIRTYPAARFTVVCGPVAAGVFARMPGLERIIAVEKRQMGAHWLPLWGAVATKWWDLVVDIRGSALSWIVPTRHRAVMRRSAGHKTEQLAAILGLKPPPLPVVWTAAADIAKAASLLPPDRPVIALAPTANWLPKIWPAERFVAAFEALSAGNAVPAVIAGPGPTERAMAEPLLAALPGAIDLVGCLSLPEIAAVLARTALFIGNDSGLMHLAAAAGAPTIGLFGPTNAREYAPAGPNARAIVSATGRMDDIGIPDILTPARDMLGRRD
jgi:ADP-heptose:LPS heptosyltransferase